jgi:NAD(P)-dependent dehydrogenase (short-subunit alcohol dehydrogenase family)
MPTALIVGASRGLGLGLVREYLARGWRVIATARRDASQLEALLPDAKGRLSIARADIADPAATAKLRRDLGDTRLDLLFLVAGVSGDVQKPIHEVGAEEAAQVYLTNAYWPVRFAESFADAMAPDGTVAFMSSILGSIGSFNAAGAGGRWETYRSSKAALNMLARSFFARHDGLTVLSLAPGWVKTDMGGPHAALDVATSVRHLFDVVAAQRGRRAHLYFNHDGSELPW